MCDQLKRKPKGRLRDYNREVCSFIFVFQVSRLLSAEYYTALCGVCLLAQLVKRAEKLLKRAGFIMPPL